MGDIPPPARVTAGGNNIPGGDAIIRNANNIVYGYVIHVSLYSVHTRIFFFSVMQEDRCNVGREDVIK